MIRQPIRIAQVKLSRQKMIFCRVVMAFCKEASHNSCNHHALPNLPVIPVSERACCSAKKHLVFRKTTSHNKALKIVVWQIPDRRSRNPGRFLLQVNFSVADHCRTRLQN